MSEVFKTRKITFFKPFYDLKCDFCLVEEGAPTERAYKSQAEFDYETNQCLYTSDIPTRKGWGHMQAGDSEGPNLIHICPACGARLKEARGRAVQATTPSPAPAAPSKPPSTKTDWDRYANDE